MKCTVCGHKPTMTIRDDCLFELSYMVMDVEFTDNMCRACAYQVSAAAGDEVKRLKKKYGGK